VADQSYRPQGKSVVLEREGELTQLRALADECRALARAISYRPDREAMLAHAAQCEERAERLEQRLRQQAAKAGE
jgi:hypothetical protein